MKKVKLCSDKPCAECPFSKQSMRGWLGDYTVDDLLMLYRFDVPFPCHMTMKTATGISADAVTDAIQSGKMQLCRGYVEMMKKCYKMPRREWLAEIVKNAETTVDSMTTQEFLEHHTVQFQNDESI